MINLGVDAIAAALIASGWVRRDGMTQTSPRKNAIVKAHVKRFRTLAVLASTLICLSINTGCGGSIYAITSSGASSKLEAAEALGAERHAPYEYWTAKEHLTKAMEEASTADYGDAIKFAGIAEDYAEKAIVLSKQAHEGSGR